MISQGKSESAESGNFFLASASSWTILEQTKNSEFSRYTLENSASDSLLCIFRVYKILFK